MPQGGPAVLLNLVGNTIDACRDGAGGGTDQRASVGTPPPLQEEESVQVPLTDTSSSMDEDKVWCRCTIS